MIVYPKVTRIQKHLGSNNILTTYNKPGTALDTKDMNVIKVALVIEGLHSTGGSWAVQVWESIWWEKLSYLLCYNTLWKKYQAFERAIENIVKRIGLRWILEDEFGGYHAKMGKSVWYI